MVIIIIISKGSAVMLSSHWNRFKNGLQRDIHVESQGLVCDWSLISFLYTSSLLVTCTGCNEGRQEKMHFKLSVTDSLHTLQLSCWCKSNAALSLLLWWRRKERLIPQSGQHCSIPHALHPPIHPSSICLWVYEYVCVCVWWECLYLGTVDR